MDLYFSPLACSMATKIALYEAGAPARFVYVDTRAGKTDDGEDYRSVNPLGLVPALRTDDGEILTENAAVLQYVADRFPEARLGARDARERTRLQQWLCFIGTELHKTLAVLLDEKAPEGAKAYALEKIARPLAFLNTQLEGKANGPSKEPTFLLDRFTVADAYLAVVLGWTVVTPVHLSAYPAVQAYSDGIRARESFARAFREEGAMYVAEQARRKKS